ncbi:MAG TPA: putative collagen-binding domain-containing protein, partial [Bacteroidales bacterium]|nr:putative collagen-binding domain-containing protein [Bacteroidales bacterium]
HTYGGGHVWLASVPEAPGGGGTWPYEKGFERTTYDYEGAVSMKHLASFFRDKKWWNMAPHPEIVMEYPQPFCLASPGEEYILYLRYGGTVKVNLGSSVSGSRFEYRWYNPGTGKYNDPVKIKGDKNIVTFNCPESYPAAVDYHDWVLYIRKIG